MSDASQGPGWWQASDGKWYPPEQAPGAQPAAGGGGGAGAGSLDIGSAFTWAWAQFTANVGPWITIAVVIAATYLVFFGLALVINGFFISLILRLIGYVLGAMFALGLIRASLAATRGEKPDVSMLFATDHLGDYIVGTILVGIIVTVGFVLCCLPGIAAAILLAFYGFYVVDRDESGTTSLSSSFNLVKDNFGNALVLLIVAWLLMAVGYITCGIALLVTGPLSYLVLAYGFKSLNGEAIVETPAA